MNAIECDFEMAGSQRLKDYGVFPHEVRYQGRTEQWRALHRALAGADDHGCRITASSLPGVNKNKAISNAWVRGV